VLMRGVNPLIWRASAAPASSETMTARSASIRMGARTSLVWCLLAMLALAGVAPAYSMHEDQAGSYDWHKSFLGEATQAAFAGSKQNMRAFVSTEQGAIGAIEFKTGNLGAHPDRGPSPRPRTAISPVRSDP